MECVSPCARNIRSGAGWHSGRRTSRWGRRALFLIANRCCGRIEFRVGFGNAGVYARRATALLSSAWAGEGFEFGEDGEGCQLPVSIRWNISYGCRSRAAACTGWPTAMAQQPRPTSALALSSAPAWTGARAARMIRRRSRRLSAR